MLSIRLSQLLLICVYVLGVSFTLTACGGGTVEPTVEPTVEGTTFHHPDTAFDLLIVRDRMWEIDGEGFRKKAGEKVRALFDNNAFASNFDHWFNAYFTTEITDTGGNSLVTLSGGGDCPVVNILSDIFYEVGDIKVIPDMVVVLHNKSEFSSDCAWTYPHVVTAYVGIDDDKSNSAFVHEVGHGFGLPDEYSGAPSYWEDTPVIFHTEEECKNNEFNKEYLEGTCYELPVENYPGKEACEDLCSNLEDCTQEGGPCKTVKEWESEGVYWEDGEQWEYCRKFERDRLCLLFWRSEQGNDLMSFGDSADIYEFGQGDWENVRDYLEILKENIDTESAREIATPEVFAPANWTPPPTPTVSINEVTTISSFSPSSGDQPEKAPGRVGIISSSSTQLTDLELDEEKSFITDSYYAPNLPDAGPLTLELIPEKGDSFVTRIADPRSVRIYNYDNGGAFHTITYDAPPIYIDDVPWNIIIPLEYWRAEDLDWTIDDLDQIHIYDEYFLDQHDLLLSTEANLNENIFVPMELPGEQGPTVDIPFDIDQELIRIGFLIDPISDAGDANPTVTFTIDNQPYAFSLDELVEDGSNQINIPDGTAIQFVLRDSEYGQVWEFSSDDRILMDQFLIEGDNFDLRNVYFQ